MTAEQEILSVRKNEKKKKKKKLAHNYFGSWDIFLTAKYVRI